MRGQSRPVTLFALRREAADRGVRVRLLVDDMGLAGVEPYAGFWQRFGVGLLRLLPMESQL